MKFILTSIMALAMLTSCGHQSSCTVVTPYDRELYTIEHFYPGTFDVTENPYDPVYFEVAAGNNFKKNNITLTGVWLCIEVALTFDSDIETVQYQKTAYFRSFGRDENAFSTWYDYMDGCQSHYPVVYDYVISKNAFLQNGVLRLEAFLCTTTDITIDTDKKVIIPNSTSTVSMPFSINGNIVTFESNKEFTFSA